MITAYWTNWSEWIPCTVLCGTGNITRSRECINTGHGSCNGLSSEYQLCEGNGDCSSFKVTLAGWSCTDYCSLINGM